MQFDPKSPVTDRYETVVTVCLDLLEEFGVSPSKLDIDNTLGDMGLDSIDALDFSMAIEDTFKIKLSVDELESFNDDILVSEIVDIVLELWLD